jgi:hypothetical protein
MARKNILGTFTAVKEVGYKVIPDNDGTTKLGDAGNRWSEVYAVNGTINTSDEREKQSIEEIDELILKAWSKVNFKKFKFNDAVNKKGENARIHFGLIAQDIKKAFESEGLDAFKYGLLCYDEEVFYDSNGEIIKDKKPTWDRYGVRYEEAFCLESAYQRKILKDIQDKIST